MASLGLLNLWDVDNGLGNVDKYLNSDDDFVKAGALLAIGVMGTGVRSEADPALALLVEHLNGKYHEKICASLG